MVRLVWLASVHYENSCQKITNKATQTWTESDTYNNRPDFYEQVVFSVVCAMNILIKDSH